MDTPTPLAVMSLLSSRSVIAAIGGVSVYRFDCDSPIPDAKRLAAATPTAPLQASASGRMEWDFSRGAFCVGAVTPLVAEK